MKIILVALASTLQIVSAVAYDAILPIHDFSNAPAGYHGQKFNPFFRTLAGCDPHPAVDAVGQLSDGYDVLNPAACSTSIGQSYTRSASHKGKFAVLFAYYFPRELAVPSHGFKSTWLSVVVWLESKEATNPFAIAYKAGEDYIIDYNPARGHPSIIKAGNALENDLGHTGNLLPLVDWDYMSPAPKKALAGAKFGLSLYQQVPFTDAHFIANLDAAYPAQAHA